MAKKTRIRIALWFGIIALFCGVVEVTVFPGTGYALFCGIASALVSAILAETA
jgi:hypothetical protein